MPRDRYLEPYRRALRRYGAGFDALLWRSRAFQRARFAVLAEVVPLQGRVVADMGCGRADKLLWMADQDLLPRAYVGVEALPELCDLARARLARRRLANATILQADFVAQPDLFQQLTEGHGVEVILFSGSLNTLSQETALQVLTHAWSALANRRDGALAFNFLSSRWPEPASAGDPAHRFDPLAMLAWALDRTPLVLFRHEYLEGRDATIGMTVPR